VILTAAASEEVSGSPGPVTRVSRRGLGAEPPDRGTIGTAVASLLAGMQVAAQSGGRP
jgi:hypothetical protein